MHSRGTRKRSRGGIKHDRSKGIARVRKVKRSANSVKLPGQTRIVSRLDIKGRRLNFVRYDKPTLVNGEWLAPHTIDATTNSTPLSAEALRSKPLEVSSIQPRFFKRASGPRYYPYMVTDALTYKNVTCYEPETIIGFSLSPYHGVVPIGPTATLYAYNPFVGELQETKTLLPFGGPKGHLQQTFTGVSLTTTGAPSTVASRFNKVYLPFEDKFGVFTLHHARMHARMRRQYAKAKVSGQVEINFNGRVNARFKKQLYDMMDPDRQCQGYFWPNSATNIHAYDSSMPDLEQLTYSTEGQLPGVAFNDTWKVYRVGATGPYIYEDINRYPIGTGSGGNPHDPDTQFLWNAGVVSHDHTASGSSWRKSPAEILGPRFVEKLLKGIYETKCQLMWRASHENPTEDDTWEVSQTARLNIGRNRVKVNPFHEAIKYDLRLLHGEEAQTHEGNPLLTRQLHSTVVHQVPRTVSLTPVQEPRTYGQSSTWDDKYVYRYDEDKPYKLGQMAFSVLSSKDTAFEIPEWFWLYWLRAYPYSMVRYSTHAVGGSDPKASYSYACTVWEPEDYKSGLVGRVQNMTHRCTEITEKDRARIRYLVQQHIQIVDFRISAEVGLTYYGKTDKFEFGDQVTVGDEDYVPHVAGATAGAVPVPYTDELPLRQEEPDEPDAT